MFASKNDQRIAMLQVFLAMIKRPIAHFDPALYTAHVMFYHRAPFNPKETQTSIVLNDMISNVSVDLSAEMCASIVRGRLDSRTFACGIVFRDMKTSGQMKQLNFSGKTNVNGWFNTHILLAS